MNTRQDYELAILQNYLDHSKHYEMNGSKYEFFPLHYQYMRS